MTTTDADNPKPYRTKLIEVGLPLEAINEACLREKQPFTRDHPRSLHIYWARRPLAACRSVLFSSLVDDPSDDPAYRDRSADEIQARRQELHDLIAELVIWENSNNERVINRARAEIASSLASFAAEKGEIALADWPGVVERTAAPDLVNRYLAEVAPPVLDPFAGGGSIPLEAQRLGLRAYASDLNPVAVLINKALIEIPPKFAGQPPVNPEARAKNLGTGSWKGAEGLAEDVRYYGQWMRDEAEKRIGHLYPKVLITPEMVQDRPDLKRYEGQELKVTAWLWARAVMSPHPSAMRRYTPLISSCLLSKGGGSSVVIEPKVDGDLNLFFCIKDITGDASGGVPIGTVARTGATCVFTGEPIPLKYIREEGKAGRIKVIPMAAVLREKRHTEYVVLPEEEGFVEDACDSSWGLPLPEKALGFRVQAYGMRGFSDLHTDRQCVTLKFLMGLLYELPSVLEAHGVDPDNDYCDALATYLALGISRAADLHNNLATWNSTNQNVRALFSRHAVPMVWDFVELNPLGGMGEPFDFVDKIASLLERSLCLGTEGWATQQDAAQSLPGCGPLFVCTDPPYYDNIGYADLADFFYAWLSLSPLKERQASFATITSPKSSEMIASKYRHEGSSEQAQAFFDTSMQKFASQLSQRQEPAVPSTIFYAFKQSVTDGTGTSSSGWETFLGGLIAAGGMVTATWPMRTERKDRVLGIGANALASSIVLACRSRPAEAGTSTRGDFVKQLRRNLGFAIADLQRSSIAPVDLRQAAIGPGMAVFSRYKQVVESDGSPMSVRDALKLINAELDEILTEQDADYDSITRFAAVWFEQHGFAAGDYGTAQTLATAQNISVESVVEAGVLEAKAGKVRLLRIDELDADWEPETDDTPTVWEMTHHLCRRYDDGGERAAADLIRRLDHHADAAQALAYRLYLVCEKEKWSEDGQSYNRLGTAWNDLARLALDPDIAAAEAGSNDAGDDATLYNDA